MANYAALKAHHLSTLERELVTIASKQGFPGHCTGGNSGLFCRTYIRRAVASADQKFSRFVGSPHYSSTEFTGRYMQAYNQKLMGCRLQAQRDSIGAAACLSGLDSYARTQAHHAPVQTVRPIPQITPSNQDALDAAKLGTKIRHFLPLPEDIEIRKRIPTKVEVKPVPRPDIKIVDTDREVTVVEPPPTPDTTGMTAAATEDNTKLYVGLGAAGALVLFFLMRKKKK